MSLKSVAAYPLRSDDRAVGILVINTYIRHVEFADEEVGLVREVAGQAARGPDRGLATAGA